MIYQSNKPYPTIKVERPNKSYARLLMESYAGVTSEETAIHLYLFQTMMSSNEMQEFSDIMETIAMVEMKHLKLLGDTIKLLGINPVFATLPNDDVFRTWDSANVNYMTDLKSMLEINIQSETNAIRNYQEQRNLIKDYNIQHLLTRIIEDEEIHLKIFKDMYQKYFQNKSTYN